MVSKTILDYQGLIHSIARHFRPDGVLICYEDLISVGNLAVMEYLPQYNPEGTAKDITYLYPRIKGAMVDEIRKFDVLSRSERRKGETSHLICRQDMQAFPSSDPTSLKPFNQLHAKQSVTFYLKHLSGKARLIVELYYLSGLKLKSIGYLLDLTESRISQVLADAIRRLKRKAIIEQGGIP